MLASKTLNIKKEIMIPKPPEKVKHEIESTKKELEKNEDVLVENRLDEMNELDDTDLTDTVSSNKVHVMHPSGSATGGRGRKIVEDDGISGIVNVPADEELFKRQYYSMREVADMFGANQSQIRFWENEFDILQPKKNKKGDRYFRPQDVKNLVLIHHLLRQRRFTIEGAKEYLKRHSSRAADTFQAIQSLEKLKAFLVEMKASLGS
jgi:DNA-binding transcriptional MerR regulator